MKKRLFFKLNLLLMLTLTGCSEPPKGMVKISTVPGDAQLYIDGERKGNSPSKEGQTFAIKLAEGEYVVKAYKSSGKLREYYAEKKVFIANDSLQTIFIELESRLTKEGIEQAKKDEYEARKAEEEAVPKEIKEQKELIKQARQAISEPEMVDIPAGSFQMGCVSKSNCESNQKPVHTVTVKGFKLAKYETSFDLWDACYKFGGCGIKPSDESWGRGERPVINVSYEEITQEFIPWLNKVTGKNYRLPTEAEWEYAARAGSSTKYYWGSRVGFNNANCDECGSKWDLKKTAPIGSFKANKFGIHDMIGNVWEVTQDCYNDNYIGAPKGGAAWLSGNCDKRVWRGGSLFVLPHYYSRSSFRNKERLSHRNRDAGFRLALD